MSSKHAPRTLGIDPGLARTGYAVIEKRNGNLHAVSYGCVMTDKTHRYGERLLLLETELTRLVREHRPTHVGIEQLFTYKNLKTAIAVGQARGVILLTLYRCGLTAQEFTPQQVKLAVSGYGKADKQQVQRMVTTLLRLPSIPKPDDIADALAVAIAAESARMQLRR